MICLKLAAVKNWYLTKIDIGGAYLCANIDEEDEVFIVLDRVMTNLCQEWLPDVTEYIRDDGKLVVKLDKEMYRLIQSSKLRYKELSGFLMSKGFKKFPSDKCIFVKRMSNGKYVLALLYVDGILIMSELSSDRQWVKDILEQRYDKVTATENERLPYLGMTIIKTENGFEIRMKSYIEETLKLHGKRVREYVVPATQSLFKVDMESKSVEDNIKFHSIIVKLLYLGKRGRPDILIPVH
jgi:hypothetical protein